MNLYGGLKRYPPPLLVIDFGTAITFDYISKRGVFEGGLIVPGVELASEALQKKATLIPRMNSIQSIRTLIPKTTKAALSSGLLNGFGALADGLIERFRCTYGKRMKVLVTGGFAGRIAPFMKHIDYLDPLHTLKSLLLIYQNEVK